jgi:hypothetical protein
LEEDADVLPLARHEPARAADEHVQHARPVGQHDRVTIAVVERRRDGAGDLLLRVAGREEGQGGEEGEQRAKGGRGGHEALRRRQGAVIGRFVSR